jgi:hypothetical protein
MKIELTQAEVERIILRYINAWIPSEQFDTVEPTGYRSMPDGFVISTKPKQETEDAAQ